MATTQTEVQTNKAIEIINYGLPPVLLGRGGDALKVPQLKEWQLAEYTAADVARWPAGNNIGIRCGKLRDGRYLYVPDFDKFAADIFPAWFHEATEIIPYLVIVKTGSGYHVPLITNEPQEQKGIIAGDGNGGVIIEIRGIGHQVVSPGSVHPSGKTYKIIAGDSLENIPIVTGGQYRQLIDLMRKYDKRPAKKAQRRPGQRQPVQPGLFSGYNCLDYVRAHIAGGEQTEKDGQIRILGNGGLLITEDKASWYCHAEQVGGNVVDMIAWHKDIPLVDAAALVRAQNEDEEPETTETAVITKTADLLDHRLISQYRARRNGEGTAGGELAGELWQDPVMVAPARDHFSGEYPDEPETKTCKTKWINDVYEYTSKPGKGKVKVHGARFSILHSYSTKDGKVIGACPHCLYERTLHLTRLIEKASQQYTHDNLMRFTIVSDGEAKRIGERIKKRNERERKETDPKKKTGVDLSVVKVPQPNDKTLIIHDVPDLDGEPLPPERPALYDLVHGLVKNTPKGRRGWRGLVTWGYDKPVQDNRGEGGRQEKNDDDLKFVARIMGNNFDKFAVLLEDDYLDNDELVTRKKGIAFDVDLTHYLQWLEDAGLDYAVIEGDLSHLRQKDIEYCAKRDTEAPTGYRQPDLWQAPAEFVGDIPGF